MKQNIQPAVGAWLASLLLLTVGAVAASDAGIGTATQASLENKFLSAEIDGVPGEYLVTLAEGIAHRGGEQSSSLPSVAEVAAELTRLYGGRVVGTWEHALRGFHIEITEERAQQLATDPWVKRVEQNRVLIDFRTLAANCYGHDALGLPAEPAERDIALRATQNIVCDDPDPRNANRNCVDNWGLDRIDQISGARDSIYTYNNTAPTVHVYTIDTGINAAHQEFSTTQTPFTRVTGGANVVPTPCAEEPTLRPPTEDRYGHGTHVAAIIGGNRSGVAKEVLLHPVKFLERCMTSTGSPYYRGGTMSDAAHGIDWVAMHHNPATDGPAVVNLSGGNAMSGLSTLAEAVQGLFDRGISFVQAAGNQSADACSYSVAGITNDPTINMAPALIVGGSDVNVGETPVDGIWRREGPDTTGGEPDPSYDDLCPNGSGDCGSNFGPCVDLFAPSAHIVSADAKNTAGFCRLSGTSMAAPHVTGAVALYLQNNPSATPQQVHDAIVGGTTCGALDANPASPYYIGDDSPNLLLNTLRGGGGLAGCNKPPVCQDDFFTTPQDTRLGIPRGAFLGNDSDPDGDALWYEYDFVTAQGGHNDFGHVGGFNYTPPAGFVGTDWFYYTIFDRPDGTGLSATCRMWVAVTAVETVHAEDSFTSNGALNGRLTEVGGLTWTARQGAETASGTARDSEALGGVPFEPTSLGADATVVLSADVDPYASGWVGVGFAKNATGAYWSAGQLWALVRPTGKYSVFALGTQIGTGKIPGSATGGYHHIEIQYATGTRLATVRINGTQVVSQVLAAVPDIHHVGLHMYQSAEGGGKVDNFELRQLAPVAQVLIRDTFAGRGALAGRTTELGSKVWSALRGGSVGSGFVQDSTAIAGVPFDLATLSGNRKVTLAVDVDPFATGWVGVGFANQPASAYWATGQLWVLLRPNDTWTATALGAQVGSGTIPGTANGGFHHVEIEYITSTRAATVRINGVQVLSQTLAAVPDIRYAGFHMHQPTSGGDKVDGFRLTSILMP